MSLLQVSLLRCNSHFSPRLHPDIEDVHAANAKEKYRDSSHFSLVPRNLSLWFEMLVALKTSHWWYFNLEHLFAVIHVVWVKVGRVLLRSIPGASLCIRVRKVRTGVELVLAVHLVVSVLEELVVLLLVVLCRCLSLPVLKFFLQLFIGLIVLLSFLLSIFFLLSLSATFLLLSVLVHIKKVFLS